MVAILAGRRAVELSGRANDVQPLAKLIWLLSFRYPQSVIGQVEKNSDAFAGGAITA